MSPPRLKAAAQVSDVRDFDRQTSVTNRRGEWVPAIPLPFYGVRKRCDCGQSFWRERNYREHYAYEHILGLDHPEDR